MAVPQPVSAPLTRAAIFLVVTINPGPDNREAVRSFCAASLSKVALAITGTRWNGPKFFGLRDKPSKGSTT